MDNPTSRSTQRHSCTATNESCAASKSNDKSDCRCSCTSLSASLSVCTFHVPTRSTDDQRTDAHGFCTHAFSLFAPPHLAPSGPTPSHSLASPSSPGHTAPPTPPSGRRILAFALLLASRLIQHLRSQDRHLAKSIPRNLPR